MLPTKSLVATAANSTSFALVCILTFTALSSAPLSGGSPEASASPSPAQAIVAYAFLRYDYLGFDRLVALGSSLPSVQNLKSLDTALMSLKCDVPKRMASPNKVLVLPSAPIGRWVSFPKPSRQSLGGWLFVMEPPGNPQRGVLVILSTEGPGQTTVFWLRTGSQGYVVKLLFDSYEKGTIANFSTTMGAVATIEFENQDTLLLKDLGEPGIGRKTRRTFRLDLTRDTATVISGIPGFN